VIDDVILDATHDEPMLAPVYLTALVIASEQFFGCLQIFGMSWR
jgi:hypothetical protein